VFTYLIVSKGNDVDSEVATPNSLNGDGVHGFEHYEGGLVPLNAGTVTRITGVTVST